MSTHPDLKFNTPTWQVERDPKYNLLVTPSRSYRGSPWSVAADYARAADRSRVDPDSRATFIGFRLVRDSMEPDRVDRGGSWGYSSQDARVANRFRDSPRVRVDNLSLRLVRDSMAPDVAK